MEHLSVDRQMCQRFAWKYSLCKLHPNKYMWYGCEAFIIGSDKLCLDNRHGNFSKLNLIKTRLSNLKISPPTHCVFLLDVLWHDLIYANVRLLAPWFTVLLHPVFDFIRLPSSGEIYTLLFGSLCCFNMGTSPVCILLPKILNYPSNEKHTGF